MSEATKEELRRVLAMVENGCLTGEEADRLLNKLQALAMQRCPWCAERIPAGPECPACNTRIAEAPQPRRRLETLSKVLILYMFAVTAIILLTGLGGIGSVGGFTQLCLAGLGMAAAVLMWRGNRLGWILGVIWSAAQIIVLIGNQVSLNRQVFHLGFTQTANGTGLGINLVGIILLVLFIKAGRSFRIQGN